MESPDHQLLKRIGVALLLRAGFGAIGVEVRCPISRYRVDVAGHNARGRLSGVAGDVRIASLTDPARPPAEPPCTALLECKQSRGDFLSDSRTQRELIRERDDLVRLRRHLEEHRIKREEPELRRTDRALFAELEQWDFAKSRLAEYRRVAKNLRRLEQKLYGETKFSMIAHYRLADLLFLVTPQGLIKKRELPAGWGLIECPQDWLATPPDLHAMVFPRPADESDEPDNTNTNTGTEATPSPLAELITVPAQPLDANSVHRDRLLHHIAIAATRAAVHGRSLL